MSNKKERRRIVKELLDVTDKEFTDEELIQTHFRSACGGCCCAFCRKLGVYIQLYSYNGYLDGSEYST